MAHEAVVIDLRIDSDEYLKLYQGVARDVVARARDGRRVRFPARILQPYVTREGIRGAFAIQFDQDNRFQGIHRLD